jgi:threonine/homoserine/homoserine lactone efflux protein
MTWQFVSFALLAVIVPGPDLAVVVSYSKSRRTALCSVAGVTLGLLCHSAIAAAGVSVALTAIPGVLTTLQCAGGIALLVLSVGLLRASSESALLVTTRPRRPLAHAALAGFIVNITNPKTWVAFVTVLPALLDPDSGSAARVLVEGGLVLTAMAGGWYAIVAVAAGRWLSKINSRTLSRTAGIMLFCLGVLAIGQAVWP